MTRLQQYLINEEFQDINKLVAMLKADCKPYLSILKRTDKMLCRGTDSPPKTNIYEDEVYYFKRKPRKDRRPLSTGPLVHKQLDDLFKKKFGWKVRSEGVFVNSDYGTASGYGHTYFFFPIGQFKYVWSPKVGDLWIYLKSHISSRKGKSEQPDLPGTIDSYIDNSLWKAIELEHEVAIKCKEYYMVDVGLDGKTFSRVFKDMLL